MSRTIWLQVNDSAWQRRCHAHHRSGPQDRGSPFAGRTLKACDCILAWRYYDVLTVVHLIPRAHGKRLKLSLFHTTLAQASTNAFASFSVALTDTPGPRQAANRAAASSSVGACPRCRPERASTLVSAVVNGTYHSRAAPLESEWFIKAYWLLGVACIILD